MSNEIIKGHHNSENHCTMEAQIGDNAPMIFETGKLAKQAGGAVVCRWGDSVVLTTVCGSSTPREGIDFFPLTVEYVEKQYAAGKIPGGFFKREARPGSPEILNARITDRSVRPLFPEGYRNEVQVITTVMSHDGQHDTDVMSLCAASVALSISEIPFGVDSGPIAGVRVGRIDGKLVANPTEAQKLDSDINIFVSVSKDAIVMVEGEAHEVPESEMVEALFFAHEEGQKVIKVANDMAAKIGKEKLAFEAPVVDAELKSQVESLANDLGLPAACEILSKHERYGTIDEVKEKVKAALEEQLGEEVFAEKKKDIGEIFGGYKSHLIRTRTTKEKTRIDGRGWADIRPIDCEVGVLPMTHGSAIFTRGETQGLITATLGTKEDELRSDTLKGDTFDKFMLHYNFPPFCVGEARMLRSTSRREIGHGMLAQRAVEGVVPEDADFPYTIRIVSEILESNGSSSMASVCGASLAMMDAGIPIKAPVAGIAMGLIQEGDDIAILSDILGDEDHIGDMDFKVCGTEKGITAIQMDIKIDGLTKEIMTNALNQAKQGRDHILGEMNKALSAPREELSPNAPQNETFMINPDKIRDVIGPGGKMIKEITAKTGAAINIEDSGKISIFAVGKERLAQAKKIIEDITQEAEVGRVYRGIVKKVVDFGAFVEIFPGCDGLLHISELADKRVEKVEDIVGEGDEVVVKCLNVDRQGKIKLSRKQAMGLEPGTVHRD